MFTVITLGITAVWLLIICFWIDTSNFRSMFLFQFTPFCLGLACIAAILIQLGMITAPVTPLW